MKNNREIYLCMCFVITLLFCCIITGCGGGGSDDPYIDYDNDYVVDNHEDISHISISDSYFDSNSSNFILLCVPIEEISGKVELVVEDNDTNVEFAKIIGIYNSNSNCYLFNVDELTDEKKYIVRLRGYNQKGNLIIESEKVRITMPDGSKETYIYDYGTSDGTRF